MGSYSWLPPTYTLYFIYNNSTGIRCYIRQLRCLTPHLLWCYLISSLVSKKGRIYFSY